VLKYDAANERATQGLAQVASTGASALVAEATSSQGGKYRDAASCSQTVLAETRLSARRASCRPRSRENDQARSPRSSEESVTKPSLELKEVPLRTVFDVIARAAGLKFLFDKDVRASRTTIVVRDAQSRRHQS